MENKKTCLHDKHVALGALMQPFAGYDMPIQYSSIIEEHNAVRTACGVFDVSHMGEAIVTGPDAERYVNHIFTNDVASINNGQILYGMMLYPDGGTVDDMLVYKMEAERFFIVINASNTDKDIAWMKDNAEGYDVSIEDASERYGQLAVQGPDAEAVTEEVLVISRTGYTGEDGFEIYASADIIRLYWDRLVNSGRCKPCSLGCRDTLRFEVGLPLYGNELSKDISPVMAGLSMFCKLDKAEFIGKEAVAEQKANGVRQKVVGIELNDHAVPRHGYSVVVNGTVIGTVTTGYQSISTHKSICMALIDAAYAKLGTQVGVQIRKKTFAGTVVKKRFYDKHYKK